MSWYVPMDNLFQTLTLDTIKLNLEDELWDVFCMSSKYELHSIYAMCVFHDLLSDKWYCFTEARQTLCFVYTIPTVGVGQISSQQCMKNDS